MSFTNYIKETKAELNHVTWPSQKQAVAFTAVVVVVSVVIAAMLGFFDGVYAWGLEQLITKFGV